MELVESLEETKRTATSVSEQVKAAKESEARLNTAREVYRPVAARGSLLYFLIDSLPSLDRVYYFSMANFALILQKGRAHVAQSPMGCIIRNSAIGIISITTKRGLIISTTSGMDLTVNVEPIAEEGPEAQDPQATAEAALKIHVPNLVNTVTFTLFSYVAQASWGSYLHMFLNLFKI